MISNMSFLNQWVIYLDPMISTASIHLTVDSRTEDCLGEKMNFPQLFSRNVSTIGSSDVFFFFFWGPFFEHLGVGLKSILKS